MVSFLTEDELADPVVQTWIVELDLSIKEKIGDTLLDEELDADLVGAFLEVPDDIFLPDHNVEHDPAEPDATMPEADDYTLEAYDEYLTAKMLLPNMGTILRRQRLLDGESKMLTGIQLVSKMPTQYWIHVSMRLSSHQMVQPMSSL